jgi:hypothetical protein
MKESQLEKLLLGPFVSHYIKTGGPSEAYLLVLLLNDCLRRLFALFPSGRVNANFLEWPAETFFRVGV